MGQSLNLYQAKPSGKKVSEMYMLAWEKGLKTTYYLRSMGATRIEKSTLDITKYNNVVGQRDRDSQGHVVDEARPTPVTTTPQPQPVSALSVEPTEDCESCQ
jgi:ribonucleoside-diphosphate reductase alpha chain